MTNNPSSTFLMTRTPWMALIATLLVLQFNVSLQVSAVAQQPQRVKRSAVAIDDTALLKQRLTSLVKSARDKAGFSGVVIVAREGKVIYEGAFGYSHLEDQRPNSLDTPFQIASLSKQFTAAAVFYLESQGKLNVDDPIHKYLPEFARESHRGITLYHLMTHTSGLPRIPEEKAGRDRWAAMSKQDTSPGEYARLAVATPLKYETGEGFLYSNFGFRVLSAVIEQVTGKAFADFMEEDIFQPLGMNQTGVARVSRPDTEAKIAEGLKFVGFEGKTREPTYVLDDSGRNYGTGYGSGGLYSSAKDLIHWDRVLAADDFLPKQQKERLFQPVSNQTYACGWHILTTDQEGQTYQTHGGDNEAYYSRMCRVPHDDLAFVVLGNFRRTSEISEFLKQLTRLCFSQNHEEL